MFASFRQVLKNSNEEPKSSHHKNAQSLEKTKSIFQRALSIVQRSKSFHIHNESTLLTTLPPKDTWLRDGVVERRTVHANVVWRERQMILTHDNICFARPDCDIIVDKILIKDMVSVGKVDNIEKKGTDLVKSRSLEDVSKANGRSGMAPESMESIQEGVRETFAFEIKARHGSTCRSYFVRVTSSADCDAWIKDLNMSLKSTLRQHLRKGNWFLQMQQDAHDLYENHIVRLVIALAILCDFLSSVFESELLAGGDPSARRALTGIDATLCIFFCLELLVNLLGNWRSLLGAPFIGRLSNWFLLGTVFFQLSGFFLPDLDAQHLKVVRVIRIFDVGREFEGFRSCRMVLKAIRRGASARPWHCPLPHPVTSAPLKAPFGRDASRTATRKGCLPV